MSLTDSRPARHGAFWPTATQVLLLRAALLGGAAALAAWDQWRALVDLDRIDPASERLLPLLAHNLRRAGVVDPGLGRHAGLLQYTWVAYQRRIARLAPLLRACRDERLPVMALKGLALAMRYYPHAGLRPMDDLDLLVPAPEARRAMELLEAHGWHGPKGGIDLSVKHSALFSSDEGTPLDLHWYALYELSGAGAAGDVWERAEDAALHGVPMRVMGPDDLFLHVIVHGARWSAVPPIRWVADAMMVLASRPDFDWTRLVAQAEQHALVLPLRHAVELLRDALDAPVPDGVVRTLQAYRPSRFERMEQRMREWTSPRVGGFPLTLSHHVRLTRGANALGRLRQLPGYLRRVYGLASVGALPVVLWRRAVKRLKPSPSPRAS